MAVALSKQDELLDDRLRDHTKTGQGRQINPKAE
jgi:hypothetical protein